MKNWIYVTLICFATIPAYAQNTDQNRHAGAEPNVSLAQDYADRVNGLLRNVHATLQQISERVEAGELTPEQARDLKLAATCDLIARLETVSAIYDARITKQDETRSRAGLAAPADSAEPAPAHSELSARITVSVQELKQESAR